LGSGAETSGVFDGRVTRVYAAHALASIGANLLITSFFFYATGVFGWGSQKSLMLVSAEGAFYIVGALSAEPLSRRFGRRRALLAVQAALALLAAVAWIEPAPRVVVAVLLTYTIVSAAGWPMFESLLAAGAESEVISRRMGIYNLVWSSVGTLTLAVTGTIISGFAWGMFFIPMASHLAAAALVAGRRIEAPTSQPAPHPTAEDDLLRHRRLALVLSRIALPATYTVIYSMIALMPSLRTIRSFRLGEQTVVASVWMAARFLTFLILGTSSWWHTRPRILLAAAVVMLVSFCGVTLSGSGGGPVGPPQQISMIAWQIPLGASMGLIYAASLYFGMVLSDGSTEHGGYHEALIGVGQVIGPAAALIADRASGGQTEPAVVAVAAVLLVSVAAAGAVTARSE
jgi:MFS transporter